MSARRVSQEFSGGALENRLQEICGLYGWKTKAKWLYGSVISQTSKFVFAQLAQKIAVGVGTIFSARRAIKVIWKRTVSSRLMWRCVQDVHSQRGTRTYRSLELHHHDEPP